MRETVPPPPTSPAPNSPAPTSPPPPAPAPRTAPRWMKIVLALSLAANLAVVGLVAGAALKAGGEGGRPGMARDLAFGPYSEALTGEQRRALWRGMMADAPDRGQMRAEFRADLDAVVASLRAEPFDAAAFRAALAQQNARLAARVTAGREGLADLVAGMSVAERLAFADRLEARLHERRRD